MSKKIQFAAPSSKPEHLTQDKSRIGQILRYIREIRGLTCPEIARKYNISAPAIYDYEMGRSFPKYRNAKELFSALRIDINIFWEHLYLAESDVSPELIARNIIRESDDSQKNEIGYNKDEKKVFLGKIFKCIRLLRGISGPEIQDKLGISTNSLYDYEKGRSYPKKDKAVPLFTLLGIDEDVFQDLIYTEATEPYEVARQVIQRSEEKSKLQEAPVAPEDPYERMMVEAFREGIKNLTQLEKTVLFRSIVNFTTQKCHKEFYKK